MTHAGGGLSADGCSYSLRGDPVQEPAADLSVCSRDIFGGILYCDPSVPA